MTNKIQEILDIFKQVDLETDVGGCSNCPRRKEKNRTCIGCLNNAKDKLLDYITNLQEENERLKQYKEDNFLYDFEELQDKVINLQKENIELNRMCEIYSKSLYNADLTKAEKRIDKALDMIDLIIPELWNISNNMTYKLQDVRRTLRGEE